MKLSSNGRLQIIPSVSIRVNACIICEVCLYSHFVSDNGTAQTLLQLTGEIIVQEMNQKWIFVNMQIVKVIFQIFYTIFPILFLGNLDITVCVQLSFDKQQIANAINSYFPSFSACRLMLIFTFFSRFAFIFL